jgi:DNA-binding beta-propeller fold protein YncE
MIPPNGSFSYNAKATGRPTSPQKEVASRHKITHPNSGTKKRPFSHVTQIIAHDANTIGVAFTPDGKQAYVTVVNSNAVIIDIENRTAIGKINAPPNLYKFGRKTTMPLGSWM